MILLLQLMVSFLCTVQPALTYYEAQSLGQGPSYGIGAPVPSQEIRPQTIQFQDYDAVPLNSALKVNEGQGQICYRLPKYLHFNISDDSYYYPRNNIFEELHKRKDVLEKIFESGNVVIGPGTDPDSLYVPLPSDLQSRVGDGLTKSGQVGCVGYRLLLRSFDSFGGRCWVVYPRHQAVSFLSCRSASKCIGPPRPYGQHSPCAIEERTVGVWAWCETLPYGERITKVHLPLPVGCKCQAGCMDNGKK